MLWKLLITKTRNLIQRLLGEAGSETERQVNDSSVSTFSGKDMYATTLMVELRRIAKLKMRQERSNHTLQPTELVGELYVQLLRRPDFVWKDRNHFLLAASQAMRHLLVDYARSRATDRRGGDAFRVELADISGLPAPDSNLILDVDASLGRLAEAEPRMARVVELKFFGGLTFEEIGKVLDINQRTAKRDWTLAREWLGKNLGGAIDESGRVGED